MFLKEFTIFPLWGFQQHTWLLVDQVQFIMQQHFRLFSLENINT
jgi:hypothetical protein